MNLPRSAADVLADHVTMELECIDRMYLNVYVPKLAFPGGVAHFSGPTVANPSSPRPSWTPSPRTSSASIHRFIAEQDLDLVHFKKGRAQRRHRP